MGKVDEPIRQYGIERLAPHNQLSYDRRAFAVRWTNPADPPPRRPELFKRIAETLSPGWFEWHDWTNRIIDACCRKRWVGIAGCSNSAKTRNVAGFAATWWLAAPECSSVIFCSTTMKSLRKRGWAEIQNYYNALGGGIGNFVDSRTVWQHRQGDDRNAIFGMAVNEGDTNKVAGNIQGIHTKRQMVVIDEAEAVNAAIWKACSNLYSYPVDAGGEFILVAIANPRFRLSQFGRYIEPEGGWDSVGIDTEEWDSKPQLDGKRAQVLRLDFCKSPNVIEGKTVSKHLPTKSRVEARMNALRERGAENDPDHLCYDRGFPPPEGLSKTVFTNTVIEQHGGYGLHEFTGGNFSIIGVFDQAFGGGDRPALRFSALGDIPGGKMGIELMPAQTLYLDGASKVPIRFQLKDLIIKLCAKVPYRTGPIQVCLPSSFGIDVTGEGGLADICQREWSPDVIRIMFSSSPSTDPCSNEDPRPANEVYRNKRAEMWFRALNATMSGQLKGIDKDTAEELCTMEYSETTRDGIKKPITLMDKKEYKLKFTKSPDLADTVGMTLEVARQKGFRIIATGHTVDLDRQFQAQVEKSQEVYSEISYSSDNEDPDPVFL